MSTTTSTPTDTSLLIIRVFNAPRDRVWAVWSDLDLAKQWWGPDGCETLELTIDARVGGKYRWRMRSPHGEMTADGEYREVRAGEKVVYTWHWADDPDWHDHDSLVTVEFIARDANNTELRLTHENLPSSESRDNH